MKKAKSLLSSLLIAFILCNAMTLAAAPVSAAASQNISGNYTTVMIDDIFNNDN